MPPKISDEAKEVRKIAILEAAHQCFSEKGYYETSIDDIVRVSNMSKGAIYTYFASKEEIFISLMHHLTERSFKEVREAFANLNTATAKLQYLIHRNIQLFEQRNFLQRVQFEFWLYSSSSPKLKDLMEQRRRKFNELIQSILVEGMKNGEFRQDLDAEAAATLYWPFRDGIWLHFLTIGTALEFERTMRDFEEMFFRYLQG
jgi:AcrR family transcriptional regulator